jgi:hypothetical protein
VLPRHRHVRRRFVGVGLTLGAVLGAAGCAGSGGAQPAVTPSLPPHAAALVGQAVTTAHGNRVRVIRYLPRVASAPAPAGKVASAVEVKACASRTDSHGAAVKGALFFLLFHDGLLRPSGSVAKRPALRDAALPPGRCERGWLSYLRPQHNAPIGVLLSGSSVVLWRLDTTSVTSSSS